MQLPETTPVAFQWQVAFPFVAPSLAVNTEMVFHSLLVVRVVEGSVRKKNESRKAARKAKEERQQAATAARQEELKRLKNLKKLEIREQLEQVQLISLMTLR